MGEIGVDFSLKRQKQFTKEIFHEHVETVWIISCDHEIMIVQSQENKLLSHWNNHLLYQDHKRINSLIN